MPGGQRIDEIVVKKWTPKVRVDCCSFECGPCERAGVDHEFESNEYYLEHFEDGVLTIYVLPEGIQHIIHYAKQRGAELARDNIRETVCEALGL